MSHRSGLPPVIYPPGWKAFSRKIRSERAKERCECRGQCKGNHGSPDHPWSSPTGYVPGEARCFRENGATYTRISNGRQSTCVLTVAHTCDCDPPCIDETHVLAMCQGCHLRLDVKLHQKHARETRARKRAEARKANHDLFEALP